MFLGLGRVILCAKCFPFRALADGCTRAPGTAIPHVPAAPFCTVGKVNGPKNSSGAAWRHFMCPSNHCKRRNWDTAIILKNPSRIGLSRPEFYGF